MSDKPLPDWAEAALDEMEESSTLLLPGSDGRAQARNILLTHYRASLEQGGKPKPENLEAAWIEMKRRFGEACKLLLRAKKALNRVGWEDGETDSVVGKAITYFLSMERLEKEIFGEDA